MEDNNEPRRILDLEVFWNLRFQVPSLPEDWHSAYAKRSPPQVGCIHFQAVWLLVMDRDQRLELLQKFFRQLFLTAKNSLDCIDILKFGIPEEQEVAGLLETFNQAVITSKEIDRYLNDARIAPEAVTAKDDPAKATANWSSQDDSFGM